MKPTRTAGTGSRELPNGELALLSSDDEQLILLNALGAVVWELCDGARSPEAIAAIISEQFRDVPPGQISADVEALIRELGRVGAVVVG